MFAVDSKYYLIFEMSDKIDTKKSHFCFSLIPHLPIEDSHFKMLMKRHHPQ